MVDDSNTAIKVLAGVGGAFACLLFILFGLAVDLYDSPGTTAAVGGGLVGGGLFLGRAARGEVWAGPVVCAYLLGVLFVMFGASYTLGGGWLVLPAVAIAALTLAVSRNYFLVVLSVLTIACSPVYVYLSEETFWLLPLAAVLWSLLLLVVRSGGAAWTGRTLGFGALLAWYYWAPWLLGDEPTLATDITVGLVFAAACLYASSTAGFSAAWLLGIALLLLPLTALPVLVGAGLLVILGMRDDHFVTLALGITGLVYFTAQYYYDLRWSLLDKSVILMLTGAMLLVAYYLVRGRYPLPRD